ncbi:MAG: LamG-like jellyroll fold domain-containing protein [Candidatus Paceibacterota bacterium]
MKRINIKSLKSSLSLSLSYRVAFTLIELLVVIAIVGILSGLIVVSMSGITEKANIAKSQVFSNSLRNSLMINLVSEWKMDGNGFDFWGNNSGSVVEATTVTSGCVQNYCLRFDGSNDHISIANNSSLSPVDGFAFEAWINPDVFSSRQTIFFKNGPFAFSLSNNKIGNETGIFTTGGWHFMSGNKSIKLSQWNHVVLSYDRVNITIYVNGVFDNSVPETLAINNTGGVLYIGIRDFNTFPFDGMIDEARFYSAGVSSSLVKQNYYSGLNSLLVGGQIDGKEYIQKINLIARQ